MVQGWQSIVHSPLLAHHWPYYPIACLHTIISGNSRIQDFQTDLHQLFFLNFTINPQALMYCLLNVKMAIWQYLT